MDKRLMEIGTRLKDMREIKGFSAGDIAKKLNLSAEVYRKYESGDADDIPVSLLYEAANLFEVELSALLTGEDPKLSVYSVVRKNKGVDIQRRIEYQYQNLAMNFIHKKMEPLIVTAKPGQKKEDLKFYSHPGQEFNFLLEGRLLVIIGGHEVMLEEGDSLYFDSGYEHAMLAQDNKPAKFLAVIA
jgi:transcriptional regulator with XRE-family HTH domain